MSPSPTDAKPPTTEPAATAPPDPKAYDNNGQYSRKGILRYEMIFGDGYVSTGGPETTDYLCTLLGDALKPGARVLDVGCGIGGAMFHLAKTYGANVTGIDLAPEMIAIAGERAREWHAPDTVEFLVGDVLESDLAGPFDVVWSRDALMHLPDKPRLFARLRDLLAPGGRLVITDYARGTGPGSPEFQAYVKSTGYHLVDPASYGRLLEAAGFADVRAEDATDKFIDIMKREADRLAADPDEFVDAFSQADLDYLVSRWKMKDGFCKAGDMKWGIFSARKPS